MRPLMISDATSVLGLQQEIQRSEESRYDHRLHGVLLVAQGMTCPDVARLLGDAPRSVENLGSPLRPAGTGRSDGRRTIRPSQPAGRKESKRDQSGVAGEAERPGKAGESVGWKDAV